MRIVCPENVISAFWKSGIHPYISHTIILSQWDPSAIYDTESEPISKTESDTIPYTNSIDPEMHLKVLLRLNLPQLKKRVESQAKTPEASKDNAEQIQNFFNERKITKVVQRPKMYVTLYNPHVA